MGRVVWSSVIAAVLATGSVVAAITEKSNNVVNALGAAAIVAAVLSIRER